MVATTDQKARMFDLITTVSELVRDGNRDAGSVLEVLQFIKNEREGAEQLLAALRQEAPKTDPKKVEPAMFLDWLGTVKIPETPKFIAREKLVLNSGRKAKPGVRIAYLGDNVKSWFLGKIEEPAVEAYLRYAKLMRYAHDEEILQELGGRAETTLAMVYVLLETQSNGEEGVLLTNGWANIFYLNDINGILRTVDVDWGAGDGGWYVDADDVAGPGGWYGGNRVFSRNSLSLEPVAV